MKNQIKNLPEFIKLIERYETITLEEIERMKYDLISLTGFGSSCTCTLCLGACYPRLDKCDFCIWLLTVEKYTPFQSNCFIGGNKKTYDAIERARTPNGLLTAYRNRAKHMRSVLEKLNIEMP